jgi:cyclopropane-fatty-acyl-phospholipid synthase
VKKTLQRLLDALGSCVPDIPFAVRFRDGDIFRTGGNEPAFTLTFRTERAAGRVLSGGALGFGEEYADGHIEVDGDFKALMRRGMDPHVQDLKLSLGTRLTLRL